MNTGLLSRADIFQTQAALVDEKEFHLLAAVKISPLNLFDYLTSRCLSIFFIAFILAAIGIMKSFIFLFTGIPIGAIFVPESRHWIFYLFPNYWLFNSLRNVFIDNPGTSVPGFWISNLVTMLQGLGYLFLLLIITRKQFGLHYKQAGLFRL